MDCPSCARKIERAAADVPGVCSVMVDVTTGRLMAELAPEAEPDALRETIRSLGYGVRSPAGGWAGEAEEERGDPRLYSVLAGSFLAAAGLVASRWLSFGPAEVGLFLGAIVLGGLFVFRGAWGSLRARQLDIQVLMTIAVVGAALLGEWLEAATVVVLFSFAEWLEGRSMTRARRAVRELMELAPPIARVRRGGEEVDLPVDEIEVGDLVVVRPGERLPVDGVVRAGRGEVDEAPITGESRPLLRAPGDRVFAGTMNQQGSLEIEVDREADASTLAHIVRAIEEAQANRSEAERFVDTFARYYTPAVIALAVLIALLPPLLGGGAWGEWFYRALVLLVIACPCALVIATPITTVSALARSAKEGILIKGGRYLETLGRLRAVAFDKTGTLTRGRPVVTAIAPAQGASQDEVLSTAALAERRSEHYLARAIVEAADARGLTSEPLRLHRMEAHVGLGVEAIFEARESESATAEAAGCADGCCASADPPQRGQVILVGSRALMDRHDVDWSTLAARWEAMEAEGETVVGVAREGAFVGLVGLVDAPRDVARQTLQQLRERGIEALYLLTGDHALAAEAIAEQVGMDAEGVRADLLPDQKVALVRELVARHEHVAMVGDGVNDAPALATASVGVAMGAAGTDVALETAHVALMADDLEKLPRAIDLGRRAIRIIKQNVALALGIKLIVLGLAAAGWATLWMAIVADMGSSLLVIFNGMRLLRGDGRR